MRHLPSQKPRKLSIPFRNHNNTIPHPNHDIPFGYEDLMSEDLKFVKAYNNQFDLTGKLNELRLLHKRKQQAAAQPRLYKLEQQYARALPFSVDFPTPYSSSSILTKLTRESQLKISLPLRRPLARLFSLDSPGLLSHPDNPHKLRQPSRKPVQQSPSPSASKKPALNGNGPILAMAFFFSFLFDFLAPLLRALVRWLKVWIFKSCFSGDDSAVDVSF